MITCKKGELSALVPTVMVLIFGAVLLVFGIHILGELKTEVGEEYNNETNLWPKTNWSSGLFDNNYTTVLNAPHCEWTSSPIMSMLNGTNCTLATQDTTTACRASHRPPCVNASASGGNMTLHGFKYTQFTDAYNASGDTQGGLGDFGDYYTLLVLGAIVGIIIGLLLMIFGGRRVG